jgi:SAM-dependent methyltransferase
VNAMEQSATQFPTSGPKSHDPCGQAAAGSSCVGSSGHSFRGTGSSWTGLPYRAAFWCWRRIPGPMRDSLTRNALARWTKEAVRDTLAKGAGRDDVYNSEYYAYVDREAVRSAPVIVRSVIRDLRPARVLDVGCGTGALLSEFKNQGVCGVGLEYSEAGLEMCRSRNLEVFPFDIESGEEPRVGAIDIVTCFEVAEHLHESHADRLVQLLTKAGRVVVFTAAVPGQGGGADHVNEQPHEYWIAKFESAGFRFDAETSCRWRVEWSSSGAASFYSQNAMVFSRSS